MSVRPSHPPKVNTREDVTGGEEPRYSHFGRWNGARLLLLCGAIPTTTTTASDWAEVTHWRGHDEGASC